MLKALEIVGFKSFADKTRFEFPPGITVVVGPNGSGKSNVVDAIKWVLGEQSVKSLRGREMADCIFNGSGTRRPLHSAEITLTLDNGAGRLPIAAAEVHITRRVYRSGEGEYLINRQACRLRDIRDLVAGTGLGTEAYSVIEQGKVDVLLQASPRDRREIFEEAAGISRFRARKLEAQRRLERVDQNLLRLADIVEEVDNRLKTVRAQASKARRYKEHTERLQELRTQVGLVDYSRLNAQLAARAKARQSAIEQRDALLAEAKAAESQLAESDAGCETIAGRVRAAEVDAAACRERIAAAEATAEQERLRCRDLDEEIDRRRKQLAATSARAGDLKQQMAETTGSVATAEADFRRIAAEVASAETQSAELVAALDRLRQESRQRRETAVGQMRVVAEVESRIRGAEAVLASAVARRKRSTDRIEELTRQLADQAESVARHAARREELAAAADRLQQALAATTLRLTEARRQAAAAQADLAQLRQRHMGIAERVAVLEELEKRQEGVGSGVKDLFAAAEAEGLSERLLGMVADVLRADVETAPLVEILLGPAAHYVVARRDDATRAFVCRQAECLAGRAGIVWLDGSATTAAPLEGLPGVVARADRRVEPVEGPAAGLAGMLLGNAWIVEDLQQALALADGPGRGAAMVTLGCEYVGPDGAAVVGPNLAGGGLISRRSQLRAMHVQLIDLSGRIGDAQGLLTDLQDRVASLEEEIARQSIEHQTAIEVLTAASYAAQSAEEEHARVAEQIADEGRESALADGEAQAAGAALDEATRARTAAQKRLAELEEAVAATTRRVEALTNEQREKSAAATALKVELAKSEERLNYFRSRLRQFEENQQERERAIQESGQLLAESLARLGQSQANILATEGELASLYLEKERLAAESGGLLARHGQLQTARAEAAATAARLRGELRQADEDVHQRQLVESQLELERTALVERFRDDFAIDLTALEQGAGSESAGREAVQEEIDELRRKINNLGNVNLEALEELEQLESRFGTLDSQYRDLVDAKAALEKIIDRINADSRRLFSEALETVRGHFQNLFRDLFGGGRADIVLEEGVDILESGIEIVARPPGKEPRSISLLSGGEKTLTCVALLLAIFRSRPSPFCVLDEVDAALDEANIDRFTKVLRDFLAWTQFIIVTHSKKTMTAASTIYGVTMQESGVSKQVSVRFEDVSEDGEIRPAGDETQAA